MATVLEWGKLSPGEKSRQREAAQQMVDGTYMVPTHTCLKCGGPARTYDGDERLTADIDGGHAEARIFGITECRDSACGHIAATDFQGSNNYHWKFGRTPVTLVQGRAYGEGKAPMVMTERQRERTREWLRERAA